MADHRHGWHWYLAQLGCLRRATYEQGVEEVEAPKPNDATTPKPNNAPDPALMTDADFGIAFHTWFAWYHGGGGEDVEPPMPSEPPLGRNGKPQGCSLRTLAQRYRNAFPRGAFGALSLVEERLRVDNFRGWGEPFAGTMDSVGTLDAEAVAWWQEQAIQRLLLQPATYLVDLKTKTRNTDILIPSLMSSGQFTGYHGLWQVYRPGVVLAGTLVQVAFRYTGDPPPGKSHFLTLLVPPPEAPDWEHLRTVVQEGARRYRTLGPQHCSPDRCWEWGRVCPVWEQVGCSRSNG